LVRNESHKDFEIVENESKKESVIEKLDKLVRNESH
jgi:hypothetical protein